MDISNKKRSKRIKQAFNLGIALLLLLVIFFIWTEIDLAALISGGVIILYIFIFQIVGFNYIHYRSDGDRLQIRYYVVTTFFGKDYNSIEFHKKRLFMAEIKRRFLLNNLYLEIKTKKGIAAYPSISLAAMSKNDILSIRNDLHAILHNEQLL